MTTFFTRKYPSIALSSTTIPGDGPSSTRPAPDPRPAGRFRYAVVIVACAAFVTSLTQALVVPVLPALPGELNVSASTAGWLVTVTVIVGAVANPLLGSLGDQFGRSRLLLVTIAAFAVGSAICAATTHLSVLLIGRAVQGLSTASIPLGIGLIAHITSPTRRASGIALVSAMLGIGGAAGLPLAGVLAGGWGLAGVFWTSAAVGTVVLIATIVLVPDVRPDPRAGGADWAGALLLAAGLTAALVPTSQGASWGWNSPAIIGLFAVAAVLLPAFCRYEMRRRHPMVDIRLAVQRPVLLTNLAGLALGVSFFISFLAAMTLLQMPARTPGGFSRSVIEAGLLMLPSGLIMAIAAPPAARLIAHQGAPTALAVACMTVLLGFTMPLFARSELWQLVLSTVVVSGGIAVAYSAMPALVLDATPPHQAAAASGVNALARNLGSALGSALFGAFAGATAPTTVGFIALYALGAASAAAAFLLALALPRLTS